MKFKCIKSFAGINVKGTEGETIEIKDKEIELDLLNAGYIEPIKSKKKVERAVKK